MSRFYGPILYTFVHYFVCCELPADAPYKHQILITGVVGFSSSDRADVMPG